MSQLNWNTNREKIQFLEQQSYKSCQYSSMCISFSFKLEVMNFLVISGQPLSWAIGLVQPSCTLLWYVSLHDGYKALYAIIKDYYPLLKKNVVLVQPTSASCTNIYEYTTKFYLYLTFIELTGHHYSVHQQVLMFIGAWIWICSCSCSSASWVMWIDDNNIPLIIALE